MAIREHDEQGEPDTISLDELRERAEQLRADRASRQRTLQLVEWLGFAAIVLGVEILFDTGWALIAAGVALVVVANAS